MDEFDDAAAADGGTAGAEGLDSLAGSELLTELEAREAALRLSADVGQ